jgi:hypothetical protein
LTLRDAFHPFGDEGEEVEREEVGRGRLRWEGLAGVEESLGAATSASGGIESESGGESRFLSPLPSTNHLLLANNSCWVIHLLLSTLKTVSVTPSDSN